MKLLTLPAIAIAKGWPPIALPDDAGLDAGCVWRNDYVRTARAKGLSHGGAVLLVHVLRNALNPVADRARACKWEHAAGRHACWSNTSSTGRACRRRCCGPSRARDYPMVVGIVLTISVLFLLINLSVEVVSRRWLTRRIAGGMKRLWFPAGCVALDHPGRCRRARFWALPDPVRQDIAQRLAGPMRRLAGSAVTNSAAMYCPGLIWGAHTACRRRLRRCAWLPGPSAPALGLIGGLGRGARQPS